MPFEVAFVEPKGDEAHNRDGEQGGDVRSFPLAMGWSGNVWVSASTSKGKTPVIRARTHPVGSTLASRERKRQQRHRARDQRAADPIHLQVVVLGSILGHDPEREQADQGAEAGRDPKDAAPRIGRKLGQAACRRIRISLAIS